VIDLEKTHFLTAWHGNMGYVSDGSGRHKGYAYGYRCIEYPRWSWENRHYTLDDGGYSTQNYVDGEECELEDVARLLALPPQLTVVEAYFLLRMGDKTLPYHDLVSWVAGCVQPEEHYIDRANRWGAVYHVMEALREKGILDMKRGKVTRSKDAKLS
jgi:hypothetical protein